MNGRRSSVAVPLAFLLACGGGEPDGGADPPADPMPATDPRLARHYEAKLEGSFWTVRIDGIRGLAHLGPAASQAVPALVERTAAPGAFEQLVALWALAEIDTAGETPILGERADLERQRLLEGDLREVTARTAFLAAVHDRQPPPRFLDRALPELYSAARGRRGKGRGEALLAAWALYEVGSTVTRETADEGLRLAAEALAPEGAGYGR